MAITRERFQQGLTYDAWKSQMTRNRERFEENERGAPLTERDLAAFRALPRPLHVLVLAEDWCGDVVANLPILGRIALESGKLELRVFLRDQNLDLIDQYLNEGKFRSIPVFAFFDDDFRELAVFIERPRSVTELRERKRREIYASDPSYGLPADPADKLPEDVRQRLQEALVGMRTETKPFADREVVRELRELVARAPAVRG
ncbi:MAG: thiol reductase thioredoxin [Chloroflexi bacterium 13_1_40CM_4_68_4]|nr:MAG: thiol reductase thioredoxin [Chloroflexi bacterium 13_1_40CM_4_68_4]